MKQSASKTHDQWLKTMNLHPGKIYWQLSPAALVEKAVQNKEGVLTDTNALMCDTGKFTGRAPKDKFIVQDKNTRDIVWWGPVNAPFTHEKFDVLYNKMIRFLIDKTVYLRDAWACAASDYRLNIRIVNTLAWHNLFCHNLFLRPSEKSLENFSPDFTIINVPAFQAKPTTDATRQPNFVIINFTRKLILIGGTGYAGEMKKSIFTVLNYVLPQKHQVFPMHSSANVGKKGDTALFFGLSGTGKTTLSVDPDRCLIGDDEHGWFKQGIFNFEGGCYAKTIHLDKVKEAQIFSAVRFGAIVENTRFVAGTKTVDYSNTSVTENTRAAYPIDHIHGAVVPSVGKIPQHIFFLTCDAYGVLPPISKLNKTQAMYHFISGYTAKVAGTEAGIVTPKATFSTCFAAPFLPLHPTRYAAMLGKKITDYPVHVWLVNTGWIKGSYGTGQRIPLAYTRAMISAALAGKLYKVTYTTHEIFGLAMPKTCPNVPSYLLHPAYAWPDQQAYQAQANQLAQAFIDNFKSYAGFADDEILAGAPQVA